MSGVADFLEAAKAAGVLGSGALVVGVSGGPDSLALLHMLTGAVSPATLHVGHLDHGMRGDAGRADAEFVAATCAAWGVACTLRTADVPAYAARAGLSPEDAARRMRYAFLAGVAAAVGARAVVVGHQADDQAETVLAHLLRGAGLPGLAGMAPWSRLPLPPDAAELVAAMRLPMLDASPALLRPLLGVRRAEIAAYCAAEGLVPREDASNADTGYARNYLRHTLMPMLDAAYPGVALRLASGAGLFAEENELLEAALDSVWPGLATLGEGYVRLDMAALTGLHPALRRRALRRAAGIVAGNLQGLTAGHIADGLALLGPGGRTGAVLHWPGGLRLRRERGAIFVERADASADRSWPQIEPGEVIGLPQEGEVLLDGYRLLISRGPPGALHEAVGSWVAVFDAYALDAGPPPVLRTRQPGDRMGLFGAGGHSRKLQDLMLDAEVPRGVRDRLALLAQSGGELLWVPGPGGRRSALAPVSPDTRTVAVFRFVADEAEGEAACGMTHS